MGKVLFNFVIYYIIENQILTYHSISLVKYFVAICRAIGLVTKGGEPKIKLVQNINSYHHCSLIKETVRNISKQKIY